MSKNQEDEGDLLGKTNNTTTTNGTLDMPIENTFWKKLLASKSLLVLREKWFNSHKFLVDILISDIKYKYPRLKHKNSFYLFYD